jgi:hypothetical protein
MTNYVKSTNFATKDTLTSGDPLKIVKGTEINTEFDNIATAVATKADLTSPTFTGTPSLPTGTTGVTQSAGNNSTALSTTAYTDAAITAVKSALFPVGAIYTATVSTNPATLIGFGTWTAFGAGRVLIGNGGGFTAGDTGGSADAIVVSHTHTATTDTSGSHSHTGNYGNATGGNAYFFEGRNNNIGTIASTAINAAGTHSHTLTTASAGASGTNANLQPYIVVYMWQRTA